MSEECARMLDAAIAEGYRTPANKVDQCEHGKYGWEDCIACYDDELTRVAERMRALSAPPALTREARDIVRDFVISLTSGGKNRGSTLTINHDELCALVKRSVAILALSQQPPVEKQEADHAART